MSNLKRAELSKSSKDLLEFTAGDLIPKLSANKRLQHVKQSAFDHYNKETKEHFQVHVTVTRHESDFLEFLQTEEISAYGS